MNVQIKPNRTSAYRFTVTERDDPAVSKLRERITVENKHRRANGNSTLYVKLQARGHRFGNRRWHQALPLAEGEYFDVYVYTRADWWRK